MAIEILLATSDRPTVERWTQVLAEVDHLEIGAVASTFDQLQGLLAAESDNKVLVLDEGFEGRGQEIARLLVGADPLLGVVLLVEHAGPAQAVAAMEVGARALVARNANLADVISRIESVSQWVAAVRTSVGQDTTGRAGRIIAVAGAKGGVGASTFSLLLAQALTGTKSVSLVDFDLQAGDLAGYLGVQVRRSVVDLVDIAADMSGRVLRETSYDVQGFRFLAAPKDGERGEMMTGRAARAIAGALRYQFDISVVDVGDSLTEASAMILEEADVAVLLVTPDLPALRAARRTMAMWDRLAVRTPGTVQIVLNRQLRSSEITRQLAARIVESPIAGVIRDGGSEFERSMNTASVLDAPTSVGSAIADLAPSLVEAPKGERSVDEAVEEIDAERRNRSWGGRRARVKDRGQATVELPLVVMLAMSMMLAAGQGLVYGAAHLLAREAAYEAARTMSVEGSSVRAREVAHDRLSNAWDRDTHISVSAAQVTVSVEVPSLVSWADMRASQSVPVTGR